MKNYLAPLVMKRIIDDIIILYCTNSDTHDLKSEYPEQYKKAMIKNLIYHAKLISSSKTTSYFELKNIEQTPLINEFPNVDEPIKRVIKNINSNCHSLINNDYYWLYK